MKFYKQRLSICRVCPESEPLVLNRSRCKQCHCIIELKALSPWSSCPAGLWLALEANSPELQDCVIADYYALVQQNQLSSPWAEACRLRYEQLFGDIPVELLYQDLEQRRSQNHDAETTETAGQTAP